MVDNNDILTKLGQNIYNYFLDNTDPGEPFLLLIEPSEYEKLKEETGNINDVECALKSTDNPCSIPTDYISIAVANLQVQLIYAIAIEQIDDSFYTEMKKFYLNLKEDSDVLRYFERFQEDMWEKVRKVFAKKNRLLQIPKQKHGSGRYVQFPKSQRLITWNELSKYADLFININLQPYQVLPFSDFCSKVYMVYNYNFNDEQNEIIKKIVFSFYCNWDGSPTEKLRKPKKREKLPLFIKNRMILSENKFKFTLRIENEKPIYYFDGDKKSEQDVKKTFQNKQILSFLYDEEYEDWKYTTQPLHENDRLLVLINKSDICDKLDIWHRQRDFIFFTENYYVYHFQNCDNNIAKSAGLSFITKEYFTIIGGIRVINCYYFRNDVLGAWYDFALPKIKLNLKNNIRVFINSKEIIINNNIVDLNNLMLITNKEKYILCPCEKEYSIKCTDLPPVYFLIKGSADVNIESIDKGWKLTSHSLRPIKLGEAPDISGLVCYIQNTKIKGNLRPFLSQNDYLQNRLSNAGLNKNIRNIELRRMYGIR
jgi:hypothetical protein